MANARVLVTGLSGLIGRALRKEAGDRFELSALNRSAVDGVPCHRADIVSLDAIRPAFEGVDTVVHLAAQLGSASWEALRDTNVTGTYNVFEAARQAKVKRVVFASSGATVSGIESEPPYRDLVAGRYEGLTSSPVLPSGLYGVSKVWGEALGRQYADTHGLSVICVRIGRVHAQDRPLSPREFSVWCSQRDIARLFMRCLEASPALRYEIVFGNSRNKWGYRDLEHTRAVLGWEPMDAAENYR